MLRCTCALLGTLTLATSAWAELVDVVADITAVNGISIVPGQGSDPDTWTMRLYAVMASGDDTLDTMYGTGDTPLFFHAQSQFYQNTFGGPTSLDIDPDQFGALPDLAFDSWVTIGADDMYDNQLQFEGMSFVAFNSGGPLYAPSGSLSVPAGAAQGSPVFINGQWRVLLGQFSIIGTPDVALTAQFNVSGMNADGTTWSDGGSWTFNAVPAPGAAALLLLASVRTTRRRR